MAKSLMATQPYVSTRGLSMHVSCAQLNLPYLDTFTFLTQTNNCSCRSPEHTQTHLYSVKCSIRDSAMGNQAHTHAVLMLRSRRANLPKSSMLAGNPSNAESRTGCPLVDHSWTVVADSQRPTTKISDH